MTNLSFPNQQIVGSVMSIEFNFVYSFDKVGDILTFVENEKRESLGNMYVIDHDKRLVGVVTKDDLVVSPPEKPMIELCRGVIAVSVDTLLLEVITIMATTRMDELPVTAKGKLVGVIQGVDIMNVSNSFS